MNNEKGSIIEQLWDGTILPSGGDLANSPELQEIMKRLDEHYEKLTETLTDEQKDLLEEIDDCNSEYTSLAEKTVFVQAFRLGAQMMLDIINKNPDQP